MATHNNQHNSREPFVVLVAFEVNGSDRQDAIEALVADLSVPGIAGFTPPFWVAEDDRTDGSDRDSAVFVTPGCQHAASELLAQHGLTARWNVTPPERPYVTP